MQIIQIEQSLSELQNKENKMKTFFKYFTLMILLISFLQAAPARGGVHTFTQPDGSTFQGYLKGDAAFHWIESHGKVVLFNPQDKFYYNAQINAQKRFELSKEKPSGMQRFSKQAPSLHAVDSQEIKAILKKLQKESRMGPHPR